MYRRCIFYMVFGGTATMCCSLVARDSQVPSDTKGYRCGTAASQNPLLSGLCNTDTYTNPVQRLAKGTFLAFQTPFAGFRTWFETDESAMAAYFVRHISPANGFGKITEK